MKRIIPLLLLLILLVPALLPFFHPGFFVTDDGEWMIIRLSDFHRSLADGQVPPRWAGRLNQSYGYPVFNFLYPGMLYFGEIFHLLGFGFVNSVKALFVATFILSAFFIFLWIKEIFKGKTEALVAALFFTYLPYHLFDVFRRGSLGEVTALTFIPLFFLGVEKKLFWLQSLAFGLMVISHNTIAALFLPLFIVYSLVRRSEKRFNLKELVSPFLIGLGLSAFFWVPALSELSITRFYQVDISQPEHYFLTGQTTSLVGIAGVFVLLLNLPYLLRTRKKMALFFSFVYLISIFFSFSISKIFWQFSPLKNIVQFPFRFLSLTLFSGAYLASSFLNRFEGIKKLIIAASLIAALLYLAKPYLIPKEFINKNEGFYTSNEGTTTVADEYIPTWVKIKPTRRPEKKVEIIKGKGEIKNLFFNSKIVSFTLLAGEETKVQVNTIYYPGWQVKINNEKTRIDYLNDKGLIIFQTPPGESEVHIEFGETPLRLFSDIISVVSMIWVILLVLKIKFRPF